MRDPGREPGQRGHGADRLVVGAVAGVHDPVVVAVAVEHRERVAPRCRVVRWARPRPQAVSQSGRACRRPVVRRRCQVVVVGERQVDVVGCQQVERLAGLVLVDQQPHVGVRRREPRDHRQQRPADPGRERRHPQRRRPVSRRGRGRTGPSRARPGWSPRGRPAVARPGSAGPGGPRARSAARPPPARARRSAATRSRWSRASSRRPPASSRAGTAPAAAPGGAGPCRPSFMIDERTVQKSHVDTNGVRRPVLVP